jgi:hypothetical protein
MRDTTKRRLMSLDEFRDWLFSTKADIRVNPNEIRPCTCGDVNCHGWRLVSPGSVE